MRQPQPMKRMIHAVVNQVTKLFYLILHTLALLNKWSLRLHHNVFIQCLKNLKYFEIIKRLKVDSELVNLCACVVWSPIMQIYYALTINAHVSNLCTLPKGITDKKVKGFYQLLARDDARSCVKDLMNEDQDYIYPAAVCSFESFKSFLILTCSSFRVEVLILTIHIFIHASFPP